MERFADDLDLTQYRMDQMVEFAIARHRRLASATLGRQTCLDCGEPIPAQRLAHVPNACRCRDCQDRQERQPGRRLPN